MLRTIRPLAAHLQAVAAVAAASIRRRFLPAGTPMPTAKSPQPSSTHVRVAVVVAVAALRVAHPAALLRQLPRSKS
jgi:hypothetical protein